ncbi:MAG: DUF2130 domain-containing protein [Acholeplasma sp.]|nr:DUF2130 domain-containing protein [Acholeplasma sp.]
MAKVSVSVIDSKTLKLESDAKKGDMIDLTTINSVDQSVIIEKIEQQKDLVYNEKLSQLKQQLSLEKEVAIKEERRKLELENVELKNQIENIKDKVTSNLMLEFEKKNGAFQSEIKALESKLLQIQNDKINEFEILKKDTLIEKTKEVNDLKERFNETIKEKDSQIEKLTYERSILNVKMQGENLEKWCDNEFNNQNIVGFKNMVWYKDNEVVEGTKADFIFKVYASEHLNESELLTSAILEMKSENPSSKTKQTNQQFFSKLHKDREKKGLEYAILVSELEWDTSNDIPIKKVSEYEKMYVVRPQYFMFFLNILTAFGYKYKDLLLAKEEEKLSFKDSQDILDEFENMKNEILDNSVRHINSQVLDILDQTVSIAKSNQAIIDAANMIVDRHLKTVINKINDFKIGKIIKKISKL